MAGLCTHIPISHEKPATLNEAYDNLTLLLIFVKALFGVISAAEQEGDAGSVAELGEHLCEQLRLRAEVIYEFAKSQRQED